MVLFQDQKHPYSVFKKMCNHNLLYYNIFYLQLKIQWTKNCNAILQWSTSAGQNCVKCNENSDQNMNTNYSFDEI